jgi:coenzyme F420 hydrogenase subunit beta
MVEKIQKEMNIDLKQISKVNIKGGLLIQLKDGDTKRISLKEIKQYAEPKCLYCPDFSAELADISVGGVGLDGWTMTVIRTEKGKEFFERAVNKGLLKVKTVNEFKSSLNLATKLSKIKRKRAIKK